MQANIKLRPLVRQCIAKRCTGKEKPAHMTGEEWAIKIQWCQQWPQLIYGALSAALALGLGALASIVSDKLFIH